MLDRILQLLTKFGLKHKLNPVCLSFKPNKWLGDNYVNPEN